MPTPPVAAESAPVLAARPPRRLGVGHPEFAPLAVRDHMALMVWSVVADGAVLRTASAAGDALEGISSAPSLPRPDTPMVIRLQPGGVAIEQIGDYRGAGIWTMAGASARIDWGKGWVGRLRPTPNGDYRLRTWKTGSPVDGPPDDDKPAVRITPAGD